MSHTHLTIHDRNKIEALANIGCSARKIAFVLGFHHSTISRELLRCQGPYSAKFADLAAKHQASLKGRKVKATQHMVSTIMSKLETRWSPEQIVGRCFKGVLSFKTIYNWIYSGIITCHLSQLRRKGKSRKPQERRGRFNVGNSISKRPKEVKDRTSFGHWELDTVVSSRGASKGCLATFVERKTRFYIALLMKNRSKQSMLQSIQQLCAALPKEALKTFTSDRGKEFACFKEVEAMGINFYFADPYASWQRGSNENANGLLREYYPKQTDLATIDKETLLKNLLELNNRPRKCLNYLTPAEAFLHELSMI